MIQALFFGCFCTFLLTFGMLDAGYAGYSLLVTRYSVLVTRYGLLDYWVARNMAVGCCTELANRDYLEHSVKEVQMDKDMFFQIRILEQIEEHGLGMDEVRRQLDLFNMPKFFLKLADSLHRWKWHYGL